MWPRMLRAGYPTGTYAYYQAKINCDDTKTPGRIHANHGGIIGIIFFQPILLNDSSKEPEGCGENRHVSAGMYG